MSSYFLKKNYVQSGFNIQSNRRTLFLYRFWNCTSNTKFYTEKNSSWKCVWTNQKIFVISIKILIEITSSITTTGIFSTIEIFWFVYFQVEIFLSIFLSYLSVKECWADCSKIYRSNNAVYQWSAMFRPARTAHFSMNDFGEIGERGVTKRSTVQGG